MDEKLKNIAKAIHLYQNAEAMIHTAEEILRNEGIDCIPGYKVDGDLGSSGNVQIYEGITTLAETMGVSLREAYHSEQFPCKLSCEIYGVSFYEIMKKKGDKK